MVKITQQVRAEFLSFYPNQKCEKAEASHPGGELVAATCIFNDLCLSTSLLVQLTQLHLDKAGSSTSSPLTMAEDIQPHWSKCAHLAGHMMSNALGWSSWLRQRLPLSPCLPRLDVLLNSTSIISCLVSVFAYYYHHYRWACFMRRLARE